MANRAQKYIEGFIARGFTPVQAAVLAGNFATESGFNPEAYNPKEDAYGGMQWRLDRKTGLEKYAKDTGRKVSDPEAQMDWVVKEMTGNEAANAAAFLAAQDPATANTALKKYIRYGDNSQNARLNNALSYMGQGDGSGNALMGTQVAENAASPLFVNPSFGGGMPGVPQWPSAQTAAPAAPSGAQNDDALINQFAASTRQPSGQSDDDLLNSFLPGGSSIEVPSVGNSADEDLLRSFMPTTPGEGEVALPPTGLVPGSKAYADWAMDQAKAGKRLPQISEIPEDQVPPPTDAWGNVTAATASYMNDLPVLGPAWLEGAQKLRSAVQGMPLDVVKEETAEAQAANPLTSKIAGVAGTVLPLAALSTVPGVSQAFGVTGPIGQRVLAGGASNALLSGADTLARGGDLGQAGKNALIGAGLGVAGAACDSEQVCLAVRGLVGGICSGAQTL